MMKTRWHPFSVFLLFMASLLLGAMYWWSGELVYPFCCEGGPVSRREAAVEVAIKIPFLRKASLVEVAARYYLSRGNGGIVDVLRGRYSEDVLLDEVAAHWRRRLAAGEYGRAGIMLAFAHRLSAEGFRTRVRKEQVEALIKGLGPNLDDYLSWHWHRVMIDHLPFEEYVALTPEQRHEFILADLKAYPLN